MPSGFEKLMRAAGTAAGRVRREHLGDNSTASSAVSSSTKTPVEVMLEPAELAALDAFIAARPEPRPSRAEAAAALLRDRLKTA